MRITPPKRLDFSIYLMCEISYILLVRQVLPKIVPDYDAIVAIPEYSPLDR
ncbi:hypothetical protein U27_05430 [Candidatus Vecturithrix granuli]|uniref:Uncharacterized protein n=1 Tax=Vecturithrix granuli TaxID=1499967 RepID=A0A081C1K1_VECG1|nr:hypothetical protein U27_05430 [Candidatus Vecturithrix granuli]